MHSTTAMLRFLLFLTMIVLSNTGRKIILFPKIDSYFVFSLTSCGRRRDQEVVNKIMEERCSRDVVSVSQGASEPLPGGIPTSTVRVINVCTSGCSVSAIHLACGWFSPARTINPAVFRRLTYNDCLVNGGKPLPVGAAVTFQYANIRPYPLSVSSVTSD